MAEGYTIKSIDEFEEMEGSGGATWRLARKTLGAEAFGFNVVDIEAGGEIPAHDHSGDNQEEVFIILEGQGTIVTDGEEHDAPAGTFCRFAPEVEPDDPEQVRRERPSAADRRPGRQRLRADALGLRPAVRARLDGHVRQRRWRDEDQLADAAMRERCRPNRLRSIVP